MTAEKTERFYDRQALNTNRHVNGLTGESFIEPGAADVSGYDDRNSLISQTQRMASIGRLSSGIAHEINTPIQYIGDNMQFFKDSFEDLVILFNGCKDFVQKAGKEQVSVSALLQIENTFKETDSEYLMEEIPRAIDQTIEGLKRVSEIASAMKQFCHPGGDERQLIDINKVVENVVLVARNEWKYFADIVFDLENNLPPVPCRPGEINQVLLNLIINAAHAVGDMVEKEGLDEKGKIRISTKSDSARAEIRISDTGSGIPEEIRHRIFDPFFTTKKIGKGTGQGLAISRSIIVNNYGGTLDYETETGKGTTMIVRLPLGAENE